MRGLLKKIRGLDPSGSDANTYEVRCDECDVSFPIGTKRCFHCGGRTGARSIFEQQIVPDPQVVFAPVMETNTPQFPDTSTEAIGTMDPRMEPREEEDKPARGSVFRAFGNLSWFLMIAALYLYRSCSG